MAPSKEASSGLEMPDIRDFRKRCRTAGLVLTHQREIIFRTVYEMRSHPTPEAIYERVREQIPSISLATVYKNVKTFLDAGLLREVSPMHGSLRVDAITEDHHHVVCTRCHMVMDLGEDELEPVRLRVHLPEGFLLKRCVVEFYGLCPRCAENPDKSRLFDKE
jgi:Fur family peroxide stress response transcriptional regulator